jgi:hypothetical protein
MTSSRVFFDTTNFRGLSFSAVVGRWRGLSIGFSKIGWRMCLGWLVVTLWRCDIEYGWKELGRKLWSPEYEDDIYVKLLSSMLEYHYDHPDATFVEAMEIVTGKRSHG